MAERARALGFFERIFEGGEPPETILAYLRGQTPEALGESSYPQTAVERIHWKRPFHIPRHHFGPPTIESTLAGITQIDQAQVLDVISLGIDQDAQEIFSSQAPGPTPERRVRGAGAQRRRLPGFIPRQPMRELSSAAHIFRDQSFPSPGGDVSRDHPQRTWCAIPLFWFYQMDGRGPLDLEGSIREHQKVMTWYGDRNIPVELNDLTIGECATHPT